MSVYIAPDDPAYDAIGYDQTRNESHSTTSTLTKHPVEDGSHFTDHVLIDPDMFSCDVVVSNKPVATNWYGEGLDRYVAATFPAQRFVPTGPVFLQGVSVIEEQTLALRGFGITRVGNLVLEMQERHDALIRKAVSCSVLTSTKQYDSMVMIASELQRGEKSESFGLFHLSFQKLTIVSTRLVAAPKPKEARGNKVVPKGQQTEPQGPSTPAAAPAPGEASSKLLDLAKYAGFPI